VKFPTELAAASRTCCFYQAVGAGIYTKHGLDVKVLPADRRSTPSKFLYQARSTSRWYEFPFIGLNYARSDVPYLSIAGESFKKTHRRDDPSRGRSWTPLSAQGRADVRLSLAKSDLVEFRQCEFWIYRRADETLHVQLAPWLNDKKTAQQMFVTNEAYQGELAGVKPNIFVLARLRLCRLPPTPSTQSRAMIEQKPDSCSASSTPQSRLLRLSLWRSDAGEKLIIEANTSDDAGERGVQHQSANASAAWSTAGDALKLGIGAMTRRALEAVLRRHGRGWALSRRPRLQAAYPCSSSTKGTA